MPVIITPAGASTIVRISRPSSTITKRSSTRGARPSQESHFPKETQDRPKPPAQIWTRNRDAQTVVVGRRMCHDHRMAAPALTELLKLSANDRAKLAMALWDSLSDSDRAATLELTEDEREELDRRWAEHLANPSTAIPWSDVRSKLLR
jgi:putative addiction module component (TIGR02574 family)